MSTKTEPRTTAAEIKKQIEEATKTEKAKTEIKDSGMPLTNQLANEINATESTPKVEPKTEGASAPSKPDQPKAAAETASGQETGSVDLKEWAKKKGIDWTTEDSILSALRKADQEFHKRQQERKEKEAGQRVVYPPPYQPPAYIPPPVYPNGYQGAYAPYPPPPQSIAENIAKQYNMTVEDVERLAAFNKDFFEVAIKQERERQQKDFEEIRLENQKNSVFRKLSSDPVFRRPDVAVEFHNVLDQMQASDPTSFEKDPSQYERAFEKAVNNIGRRYLEGRPLEEGISPKPKNMFTPPTTPPREVGKGSGGSYQESETSIDPKEFAKFSLEEKRKLLDGMGLRPSY